MEFLPFAGKTNVTLNLSIELEIMRACASLKLLNGLKNFAPKVPDDISQLAVFWFVKVATISQF